MDMDKAIIKFPEQLAYEPEVKNYKKLKKADYYIVCGMGGSHLSADLLKITNPDMQVIVHSGYGLPDLPVKMLKKSLVIASSYSGNTEETLDAYDEAKRRKIPIASITVGGQLLEKCIKDNTPMVVMPNTGIQPRSALGFSLKALLAIMGKDRSNAEIKKISETFSASSIEHKGKELAEKLSGFVPVIYSSGKNQPIAYIWKIKFNETGKIPAFYNVFSELNHNEMTGFDVAPKTKKLSEKFHFIILKDGADDERIQKRMNVLKKLYEDRGLPVTVINIEGESEFEKIFSSIILADWTAYHTAKSYDVDPANVPMVEEFKKLVA